MFDLWRNRALGKWAAFVCDHPWWVLGVSLGLAAVSIALSFTQLAFHSDRNDLISPKLDWNRRYIEYRHEFESRDRIVLVVETPLAPDGPRQAEKFVDTLAAELQHDTEHVARVWSKVEAPPILVRLLPLPSFSQRLDEMVQSPIVLKARSLGQFLTALTREMQSSESRTDEAYALEQIQQLRRTIAAIAQSVGGRDAPEALADAGLSAAPPSEYLKTDDGRLLFIDVEVKPHPGEVDPMVPGVKAARQILASVSRQFPGVRAGLTGVPVMEADETTVSTRDAELSAIYSAIAIAILLVLAYHGWKLPLLAIVSLLVGVAWSFGYLTLAIGYLQVLSIVFTTILLGLGIDYGVHLMSRFELVRHDYPDGPSGFRLAMIDTMQRVGPGMISGALMTAIAFGTTMFTDFTGMAEMGTIAAVGLILCLIAMWTVFPSALRLLQPAGRHITPADERLIDLHTMDYLTPIVRHPRVTLLIWSAIALVSIWGVLNVRFDNNLLHMMPRDMDSIRWIEQLERSGQPMWDAACVTGDLATARSWAAQLRTKPTVQSLGGIGRLFPEDNQAKVARIAEARKAIGEDLLGAEPVTPVADVPKDTPAILAKQLGILNLALEVALGRKDVRDSPPIFKALTDLSDEIKRGIDALNDPRHDKTAPRQVQALQEAFRAARSAIRVQIDQALQVRDLTLEDLPEFLRRESVSQREPIRYVLKTYPKENVWEPEKLARFIADLRSVDPTVTGSPVQIHESGILMKESYKTAGILAVAVVLGLVYLDFLASEWTITFSRRRLWVMLVIGLVGYILFRILHASLGPLDPRWWVLAYGVLFLVLISPRAFADSVMAMLPVTLGFVTTFGVMWLTGYSINPANLMVLPLLFGIGVASGVNIIHRYKLDPRARPLGLSQGTGKAIPLTSATAIIAFAAMLPAHHRGIRSLGFVLTVGISLTLLACMTVMPAILEIRNELRGWRRLRFWNTPDPRLET